MNTAGVDARSNGAHNWSTPTEMSTDTHSHNLLQPKDYFKLPVPAEFGDHNPIPLLTPSQYIDALKIREEFFTEV
jgi:hypothetical protein